MKPCILGLPPTNRTYTAFNPPQPTVKHHIPKKDEGHTMVQWCHSLRLFQRSDQKEGDSQEDQSKGQHAVICAWSDNIVDPYSMVANIAQSTGLPYIANLLPFGNDQASFFWFPRKPSNHYDIIWLHNLTGYNHDNRWNESVDTIEPTRTRFEG